MQGTIRKSLCKFSLIGGALLLLLGCGGTSPIVTVDALKNESGNENYSFNAMAPLELTTQAQWDKFEQDLISAKQMGLDGISVDIWWGKVESAGDQQFNWGYYHKMADLLVKHDLQWIPIMSFHQCGGNVGDTCNIPIPSWIWTHFEGVKPQELMFESEQGNFAKETLSFWQDKKVLKEVYQQYAEFMTAFQNEFADKVDIIQELNVSMGPAGELRYPSYNSHDKGTGYPTRGAIQGFSRRAQESFNQYLVDKNQKPVDVLPDFAKVFANGDHLNEGVSRDYLNWYHQSLVQHGESMLNAATVGFDDEFAHLPLGYKIPGIHWTIAAPKPLSRAAELAAGLIPVIDYTEGNAFGYDSILSVATEIQNKTQRSVIVHFTALEMSDEPNAPAYSKAKTLVTWLANGAQKLGVQIKGENALAAGVYTTKGWNNIDDALKLHYSGLTVLRVGNVADNNSNAIGYRRYQEVTNALH